jgi:EIX receptor 1/2
MINSLLELPYLTFLDHSSNYGYLINHSKSFTSLESLVLDRNQLKGGIPKFLGDICSLRELDLFTNNINGKLVDLIKNLSGCAKDSLEVLDLGLNQITGSLPDFTIFSSLKQLVLKMNIINATVKSGNDDVHFKN